jgi:hypothetical protein
MALPNSYDSSLVKANVANGINSKEVNDVPVRNVEQLLQGKAASLNLKNKPGAPGVITSNSLLNVATVQSHPVEGWDHYFMYITNNSKFKGQPRVGKSVQLTFSVDSNGLAMIKKQSA